MRIITYTLIILLILIGAGFAALNSAPVTINLYIRSYSVSTAMLTVVVFGLGLLFGFVMSFFMTIKMKRACRHRQSQQFHHPKNDR